MERKQTIFIVGSGAVGFPLAAYLANAGRSVVAVRTRRNAVPKSTITATVQNGEVLITSPIETVSLSNLRNLDGIVVVATKSYINQPTTAELKERGAGIPLIIMQNGVGSEQP